MRLFVLGVLSGCGLSLFLICCFFVFEPDVFLCLLPTKSEESGDKIVVQQKQMFDLTRPVLVEHSSGRRFVVRPNGEVFVVGRGDRRKPFGTITIKNTEDRREESTASGN